MTDPIAAQPDDVVAWTTGTNTPGEQAVIQVADGMQLPPGTNLCLAATLRRERERAEQTALRAQYWKDIAANKVIESVEADRDRLAAECERLREDALRYRWLRERMAHQQCGPNVGWTLDTLLPGDDPDAAIDAARAGK